MKISLILIVTCLISGIELLAKAPPIPRGKRLRDIVVQQYPKGNLFIGGTTGWRKLSRGSGTVLNREFSYVTPENDFKQSIIHPKPDVWNWTFADAWIKRCAENNQVLRLHGPISPQCSKWTKDDSRTASELKQNLEEYMTALCKRYDKYKHVKWIDVINETVTTNGAWFGPRPGTDKWENPWPKIGYDNSDQLKPPLYIKLAFAIANRHAPNTKLIINQHGSMEKPMWQKIKATVLYLRRQGLRVDGIGWQAHINVGWELDSENLNRLRALIDWAHANKLSFHVTENNVWLKWKKNYKAQAATFAAILKVLIEKRHTGVVTWNVWNISDGDQWRKTKKWAGCILFDDFSPKPAYYAIQQELLKKK
jgi:endo-1,4-beta-xylanase